MRLSVLLSICALLLTDTVQAQAIGSYATQTGKTTASDKTESRITLELTNVSLKVALQEIARQGNLKVALGPEVHAVRKLVSLNVRNVSARDAIANVLKGTGIEYTVAPSGQLVFVAAAKGRSVGQGVIARIKRI